MTTIALNRVTTDVPAQWAHLNLRSVLHFDWAGCNATAPCDSCGNPLPSHLWRVRSADGAVIACGMAS